MTYIMGEAISVAAIMAIQALFFSKMLEMKKASRFIFLYCIVTVFTHLIGIPFWTNKMVAVKIMLNVVARTLLINTFAKISKRRLAFAISTIYITEILTELLLFAFTTLVFPLQDLMSAEDNSYRVLLRIISLPIFFFINAALCHIWDKSVSDGADNGFRTFSAFVFSQALMLSVICVIICISGEVTSLLRATLIVSVAICGVSDIFVFRSIKNLSRVHTLEKEHLLTQNQLNAQLSYYDHLTGHMQHMNMLRHDFQNQIQTAHSLFESGNRDVALSHLSEIEAVLSTKASTFCANPIIDAIMVDKSSLCDKNEIRLKVDCRISSELPIEGFALCGIFANIMDNAIQACSKLERRDREISMVTYVKSGWLIISCENKCTGTVLQDEKQQFLPEHGLGLSIIEELVEKYDGKIEHTEDSDKFKITVWLSCSAA
jgi:Signal transduction histidine kinase regulating citrate/malate metabolism